MTVKVLDAGFALQGDCPLEDAETLLRGLAERTDAIVDWRECGGIHTAVLQVLMAWDGAIVGPPRGDFLQRFVARALATNAP